MAIIIHFDNHVAKKMYVGCEMENEGKLVTKLKEIVKGYPRAVPVSVVGAPL